MRPRDGPARRLAGRAGLPQYRAAPSGAFPAEHEGEFV
jgi:hypothetical protein